MMSLNPTYVNKFTINQLNICSIIQLSMTVPEKSSTPNNPTPSNCTEQNLTFQNPIDHYSTLANLNLADEAHL